DAGPLALADRAADDQLGLAHLDPDVIAPGAGELGLEDPRVRGLLHIDRRRPAARPARPRQRLGEEPVHHPVPPLVELGDRRGPTAPRRRPPLLPARRSRRATPYRYQICHRPHLPVPGIPSAAVRYPHGSASNRPFPISAEQPPSAQPVRTGPNPATR